MEKIIWVENLWNTLCAWWEKCDKSDFLVDLLTGVVIPILVTLLACYLTSRSEKKKINSRLSVELFLIEKEIKGCADSLALYLGHHNDYKKAEDEIAYVLNKHFSEELFSRLEHLHMEHPVVEPHGFLSGETSATSIKRLNKIEKLDEDISKKRKLLSSCLEENKEMESQIAKLELEKNTLIEDQKSDHHDIYHNLNVFFGFFQNNYMVIPKHKSDDTGIYGVLNYIQRIGDEYLKLEKPTLADALNVFHELLISNAILDKCKPDDEKVDEFWCELGVEKFTPEQKNIYEFYRSCVNLRIINAKIESFIFCPIHKHWDAFSDDLVLLNNREFYFLLYNYYQKLEEIDRQITIDDAKTLKKETEDILNQVQKQSEKLP